MKKIKLAVALLSCICMAVVLMPNYVNAATTVTTQDELLEALAGDETEITLGNDITIEKLDNSIASRTNVAVVIQRSVTINGNGYKITNALAKSTFEIHAVGEAVEIEFNDIEMVTSYSGGRTVYVRTGDVILSFNEATLRTTGSGNTQTLSVGGNVPLTSEGKPAITINVNNSTVNATDTGYAFITYNPVTLNVTGSTLYGYAALYFKGEDSSYGSKGSVATVTDSTLTGVGHVDESFGTVVFEDKNITLNVVDSTVNANGVTDSDFNAFKWSALNFEFTTETDEEGNEIKVPVEVVSGNKVTVSGTSEIKTTNEEDSKISNLNTENTIVIETGVKSDLEIDETYLPEGTEIVEDENGNFVVVVPEENPDTYDNVMTYIVAAVIGLLGVAFILNRKKTFN